MTNRQSKGTPVGGQFSEGKNPDGPDLAPDRNDVDLNEEIEANFEYAAEHAGPEARILEHQSRIDDIDSQREARRARGEFDSDEDGADSEAMFWESQKIVALQNKMLERQKLAIKDREDELAMLYRAAGDFRLNGIIRDNIRGRLNDDFTDDDTEESRAETFAKIDELLEQHFSRFDPADNNLLYEATSSETDFFMERLDLETMTLRSGL